MENNSIKIAIKLLDYARSLGIPSTIMSSMGDHSDSRYVLLFPGTISETQIRVSGHSAKERRFAISLDSKRFDSAVERGIQFLEETYGSGKVQEIIKRGGLAPTDVSEQRRRRFGPARRREWRHPSKGYLGGSDRVCRGGMARARDADPFEERAGGKAWRLRPELAGDD